MSPDNAAIAVSILILGFMWLDRDVKDGTSWALWIPVVWLSLAGSRSVSQWMQLGPPVSADQILEGSPLDRLVYTGLLLVGVAVLASRKKQVATLLRANVPILLFFVYCAVSFLWSDFPEVAFKRWIKALGDLVVVLIVWTDPEPIVAIKQLLARTGYLLIPLSVLFIKYFPDLGRGYGRWDGTTYYTGVTTAKNSLGAICLLLGLASVWRIFDDFHERKQPGGTRRLVAQGVILTMVLWLFWIANSMTSLSCFLLASALIAMTTSRAIMRRPALLHVLLAAMIAVCVAVLFLDVSPDVLKMMGRNPTLTDRTEVWSVILGMSGNSLVGTGFESFWLGPRLGKLWAMYTWGPTEAHNGYIEIFLNLGWAGVVLLALVLLTGYRTVVSGLRRALPASSLMLALFFVGIVFNFTEAAFFRMMTPTWILLLLAIIRVPVSSCVTLQTSG